MFKRILTYSILSLIALGGFFGNVDIKASYGENNGTIYNLSSTTSIYAESLPPPKGTTSVDLEKKDTTSSASIEMYNKLIGTINIALAVLSAMISPIILFVGWLMSPDWTSGDLFGLRAPMYALWVTVSNIVYFIYAILLILIALGTMFGQDKFSYKVMLPKLALGIIMVPFTWWFVQWTISIASVVTATVMTIPAETIASGDSAWFNKPSIPKGILIDSRGSGSVTETKCEENPDTCISPKVFLKTSGGMYGPLIVYGYSIFKFKEIQELKSGLDIASAALQIVHTSIISTIMFAVFGLLTLALSAMLLVRAMKLWMYAIFAPLFTFRFVAGSNLLGGDDDSFSIKEFIGLAFVPAIVGLTLSFGLIIINAVQGPANPSVIAGTPCNLEGEGCTILNIMGSAENKITRKIMTDGDNKKFTSTTFAFGGVEFLFLGKATNQVNTSSTASGAIDAVGGMFGTLIVDVIALVFIWMSFMAAKNVSKAVKAAVEPFEKIGQQVGGLAKSIPKYTPLPIPGGSIAGMGKVTEGLARIPEHSAQERYDKSNVGKWIKSQTGQNSDATKLATTQGIVQNGNGKELQENLKQYNSNDNKDLINILRKDSDKLVEKLKQINTFTDSDRDAITKIIKDPNASIEDTLKVQAALQSGKWIDLPHGKDALKTMIDNISKQGTTGAGGVNGSNNSIGVRLTGTEKVNISIGGSEFTIENIAGKKDVTFGDDDSKKLTGKKAGMTEENFKKSLMNSGTMTDEAATDLINKITAKHKDFFDPSSKT